jgi:hypothetical protein
VRSGSQSEADVSNADSLVRSWPGADPGPLASREANTMRLLNRLRRPDRLAESGQFPLELVCMNP